ncbi:MAG: glycosyltransferase [Bacteroidetes bacterium]|jgi:glycosyltransferase involved in cell wall biosynthesis|nr:glycosyltransferase [Bacteroidota bacterium]
MNILMLTNKLPFPIKDGGAYAMASMYNGYQQEGLTVKMLSMNTFKHKWLAGAIPENVSISTIKMDTRVKPLSLMMNLFFSKTPYNYKRFYSYAFENKLIRLLEQEKFDVIQLEGLYLGHYIDTIRNHSDAHIVLRAHNVEHAIWNGMGRREKNWFKRYYFNLLSKRLEQVELQVINNVDSILAISSDDAIYFESKTKIPVFVSPTSFEKLHLTNSEQTEKSIFFMGSLDWIPNQDALWWFVQHVWKRLYKENPKLNFFIAGRNCPKLIRKKLKKEPGIRFKGEVDSAPEFMQSHGIFVLPLFAGSGLRIRIVEAMSLGVPIVASSLAVKGINCKSHENIIIANDSNEFYKGVYDLLNSDALYKHISNKAKEFVNQEFDQEKIMEGTVSFLRQFVA